MKTNYTNYMKASENVQKWHVVDATDLVVGRLAGVIARIIQGKHKPEYSPNLNCGDKVIVTNIENILFTGNKMDLNKGKLYRRHTGYMGGLKEVTAGKVMEGKNPERILTLAVKGMLKKSTLGHLQLKNLYVYKGSEHPHEAQQPAVLDVAKLNAKNSRGMRNEDN